MKIKSIVSTVRQLELQLEVPDNVFKPSFMTAELLRGMSLVPNISLDSKILDFGTGSGIIALCLHEVGFKNIYVSDKYKPAIRAARKNFEQHGFSPKQIYLSDMFNQITEKFDLIITNPPAFPTTSRLNKSASLDGAIFSGTDGREFIRNFISRVMQHLNPDGRFLMTAPAFLDWVKLHKILHDNRIDYTDITSEKCVLPTYGYPEKQFIDNFQQVFQGQYYDEKTALPYGVSAVGEDGKYKIEYRVKTICGKKAK
jgi:methylase of polypeptide subunit release factors